MIQACSLNSLSSPSSGKPGPWSLDRLPPGGGSACTCLHHCMPCPDAPACELCTARTCSRPRSSNQSRSRSLVSKVDKADADGGLAGAGAEAASTSIARLQCLLPVGQPQWKTAAVGSLWSRTAARTVHTRGLFTRTRTAHTIGSHKQVQDVRQIPIAGSRHCTWRVCLCGRATRAFP